LHDVIEIDAREERWEMETIKEKEKSFRNE
jgi:hypothetical protein